jgi:ribosomal protein S27AE
MSSLVAMAGTAVLVRNDSNTRAGSAPLAANAGLCTDPSSRSVGRQAVPAGDVAQPSRDVRTCGRCGGAKSPVRRKRGEGVGYRLVCEACNADRLRERRATDLGYSARKNAEWQARHPEKRRAHKAVERELAAGRLVRQPCERCGSTVRIEAHHDNYFRALDVMWLCRTHHIERHNELRCVDAE